MTHKSWDEFSDKLTKKVGAKRAHLIFCEQTGYPTTKLYMWKRAGLVPHDAYMKINDIDLSACDQNRFKGYHTQTFFNRVVELSNDGYIIREIAQILTKELGRKITDGAVKSARFRFKDQITDYKSRS